ILFMLLAKDSLERIGAYDDIVKSLEDSNVEYIELDGVTPCTMRIKARDGAEMCRREGIEFVLAVGGRSVLDCAKAIVRESSLGLGVISTIPAASTDIADVHPTFSIINPELTATLPQERIAQNVVDILAHMMDHYFTNTTATDITDRMMESAMKTVVRVGQKYYLDGYDFDIVSQIMCAAAFAHSFPLCVGRQGDFAAHCLSRELSKAYGLPHTEALSVIYPAWLRHVQGHNSARMAQFCVNVMGVENSFLNVEGTIERGIAALEQFYISLGMPIRIGQTGIANCDIDKLAEMAYANETQTLGTYVALEREGVLKIYELAL
ncbi:MAG: iron-containing alcohol dehydrogenase, partial [Defluviitaleaceae bacterium]|nr:iron-containing alcohol dehydrogenase [Defluviitaleaceae bacterium]